MDSEKRVFSEKEASEIVQRAARLHEAAFESSTPYTPGITREELVRIAKEIGVDPKFIEQAILEGAGPESRKGVLHLTEEFEQVVQGELSPDRFDLVLDELKVMNRHQGVGATQVGRTLQATHWTGLSQAQVQITSRSGRTRVNVKSNALFAWLFALHPAFILSVIALASTGEHGMIATGLAITGVLAAAGWTGFRALLKKGHPRAGQLAERLSRTIAEDNAAQAHRESKQ
ncbi:MAG: hypothetical protein H6534_06150, partial [Chthonomonadaceae bacterium]|nr:hypothetical protein [Chthonomonadaceae bacterium]